MTVTMERKTLPGHLVEVKSETEVEGVAHIVVSAYGNVDHDGDIVVKGACAKQIKGDYGPNPKGLLDHDWSMRSACAKTLSWWEEDDGLHIEAQYNLEKEVGRDAFSDLKFYGEDMEFSVGYQVKQSERPTDEQRKDGARRVIVEWQINEWSHVMLGANSDTYLVDAKGRELSPGPAATDDRAAERKARGEAKALVGSYQHLTERLRDALRAAYSTEWLWVRGTMPSSVVFETEVDDLAGWRYVTYQVEYTATDDGFDFGEPVEVRISEVVEPKALAVPATTDDPAPMSDSVRRFRHLVATTSTAG